MAKVAVIGATTWGTTLGWLLAGKGIDVSVWARSEAKAVECRRQHQDRLLQADLGRHLTFTSNEAEALGSADFAICAVPAQNMRQTVRKVGECLKPTTVVVSVAKGLEAETGKRMSEVIAEEIVVPLARGVSVLSGPNLSKEIDQGLPATSVVAAEDIEVAKMVQKLLESPHFYLFVSDDLVGVELCGALKNVIAIGAGILDGLDLGNNAKAAFITMGWNEVVSLGKAMGAREDTFYGLAGFGDLIATGNSPLSRNHYVGYELGKGRPLGEILASMTNVAEGIDTTVAAYRLSRRLRLEFPTIDLVYRVLFESLSPAEISTRLRNGFRPEAVT
ncbi:MAG: NAD(P)-dependent glycerol-3-phosphate dehydrogenase [Chloroflexi bacterium]|nr:NAD(P)-dependent glycerol-3-phosphate dehydrogenase [Chloroflexota bacterium]MBM3183282.1 NAD(P)-dependent glycerol-3-phosphate dehydrogenase [Chloroflexota bacterium]MBM4451670.1 NAD(P)-dependent glycerol-3-phosphate dehydrogenase [Chloroflexota bacterium]MBM4454023.1 NAD(P)-dependent glycerol-3-phosphate dehydrogenase [Chloroflexota bacterium]